MYCRYEILYYIKSHIYNMYAIYNIIKYYIKIIIVRIVIRPTNVSLHCLVSYTAHENHVVKNFTWQ